MKKISTHVKSLVVFAVALGVLVPAAFAQKLIYPTTKKSDTVDTYFGVKVADPYRWLEDDNSAETRQWVQEENALTFSYLDKIPYRQQVRARLEKLLNYPK